MSNSQEQDEQVMSAVVYVCFDQWLRTAIKSWHPEYNDERLNYHINSLYTASQCFPDENGEMADVPKQQVINCLTLWRSMDN